MATINGRLVNGKNKIVQQRRAAMEARFAYHRSLAENSATPLGQTATWGNQGDPNRPNTNRKEKW